MCERQHCSESRQDPFYNGLVLDPHFKTSLQVGSNFSKGPLQCNAPVLHQALGEHWLFQKLSRPSLLEFVHLWHCTLIRRARLELISECLSMLEFCSSLWFTASSLTTGTSGEIVRSNSEWTCRTTAVECVPSNCFQSSGVNLPGT